MTFLTPASPTVVDSSTERLDPKAGIRWMTWLGFALLVPLVLWMVVMFLEGEALVSLPLWFDLSLILAAFVCALISPVLLWTANVLGYRRGGRLHREYVAHVVERAASAAQPGAGPVPFAELMATVDRLNALDLPWGLAVDTSGAVSVIRVQWRDSDPRFAEYFKRPRLIKGWFLECDIDANYSIYRIRSGTDPVNGLGVLGLTAMPRHVREDRPWFGRFAQAQEVQPVVAALMNACGWRYWP